MNMLRSFMPACLCAAVTAPVSAMLFIHVASAQQLSAEGQVRAVTLMAAVAGFCPPVIPTDRARAEQIADAETIVGKKLAGTRWKKLLLVEAKRRYAEVAITGPQIWCENQRRMLREIGEMQVFP